MSKTKAAPKAQEDDGHETKPNEVAEEEVTVIRTTFRGSHWKLTLSEKNLEKYPAMKAEDRLEFLLRKVRLDSKQGMPGKDAIGESLTADLRRIRKFLDGGRLVGTRGPGLDTR